MILTVHDELLFYCATDPSVCDLPRISSTLTPAEPDDGSSEAIDPSQMVAVHQLDGLAAQQRTRPARPLSSICAKRR